jgi:hypothetical protein
LVAKADCISMQASLRTSFFSDDEVETAASGPNPEITLVNTGEIYRCAVN